MIIFNFDCRNTINLIEYYGISILQKNFYILFLSVLVASTPDWEDTPGTYQFTSYMIGAIVLNNNGEQMGDDGDMFAAFDEDGIVRGVASNVGANLDFGPYAGTPVWEMTMRSNNSGDLLSFKFYDDSENQIFDISETYEFIINEQIGNVLMPVSYNFVPIEFVFNQSTLQAFYFFQEVTINNEPVASNDWVGVFNGDVCVGSLKWDTSQCGAGICSVGAMGNDGSSQTVGYMIGGLIPTFKIYDTSENIYIDATPSGDEAWFNLNYTLLESLSAIYVISGCMDQNACNYNSSATEDDNSCIYPEENFDCYGNCIVNIDCNGDCGGIVVEDACGICGGDSSVCTDCLGIVDGTAEYDCNGVCDGDAIIDECGVCGGNGIESSACDCEGNTIDACGICNGPGAILECGCENLPNGSCDCDGNIEDCTGICGGDAVIDECGICNGNGPANGFDCEGRPELFQFYQSTLQAFYFFQTVKLNNVLLDTSDWVGAFNDNVCVGSRKWNPSECGGGYCDIPAMGYDGSGNTTGYMTYNDVPNFKIYDSSKNIYFDATPSQEIAWTNNGTFMIDSLYAFYDVPGCIDANYCNYDPYATIDDGSCDENDDSCLGCIDSTACNYHIDALIDDGSCYYPDNFDCDGNCLSFDCMGICGGDAILDDCGICNGDSSSCEDCAGVPNGDSLLDMCGNCDANTGNDCQQDCLGIWGGNAIIDACSVCNGDSSSCEDCAGVPNGDSLLDMCGNCDANTGNDCQQDCLGIWGGNAEIDICGVCDSDLSNNDQANTGNCDCFGESNGTAYIDGCNICVGGSTGLVECSTDCLGNIGGSASYDNCNVCDDDASNDCQQDCSGIWGGDATLDECGICTGDSSSCKDCAGVPNGNSLLDMCGNCDEDTSNDCQQDCSGIWGGDAILDQCGICNGDSSSCEDCAGVTNGNAYIDECGNCDSNIGNDCSQDCMGVWGGNATADECGVCNGSGPLENYNCSGVCISNIDCSGICGGDNAPTYQCGNIFVCSPAQCSLSTETYMTPNGFNLNSIYPNPFNPTTTIQYELESFSSIMINVFDVRGQLVSKLFSGSQPSGIYEIIWNASGNASGLYFIEINFNDINSTDYKRDTRKVLYLK